PEAGLAAGGAGPAVRGAPLGGGEPDGAAGDRRRGAARRGGGHEAGRAQAGGRGRRRAPGGLRAGGHPRRPGTRLGGAGGGCGGGVSARDYAFDAPTWRRAAKTMTRRLFGTDGIRGLANVDPMTPEVAMRLGMAIAARFRAPHSASASF